MMKWLDRIPLTILILIALPLAVAPVTPQPHLIEKLQMLASGTLTNAVDIFDLFLHGLPVALVALKLLRRTKDARRPATN
jgi:hypothetical protein